MLIKALAVFGTLVLFGFLTLDGNEITTEELLYNPITCVMAAVLAYMMAKLMTIMIGTTLRYERSEPVADWQAINFKKVDLHGYRGPMYEFYVDEEGELVPHRFYQWRGRIKRTHTTTGEVRIVAFQRDFAKQWYKLFATPITYWEYDIYIPDDKLGLIN